MDNRRVGKGATMYFPVEVSVRQANWMTALNGSAPYDPVLSLSTLSLLPASLVNTRKGLQQQCR